MLPWNKKGKIYLKTIMVMLFLVITGFLFLKILPVAAQEQDLFGLKPVDETIALGKTDIRLIIAKIIRAALGLVGIIVVSLMVYAGYLIMTSGGNEEKVAQGKKIIINAVIGLAIILSALAIVQFVIKSLGEATGIITPGQGGKVTVETFSGSGALGRVIKDHYPFRDQQDVPRNTNIVVTFFEPIDPVSIIKNTNNSCWGKDGKPTIDCVFSGANPDLPYYGDCLDLNQDKKIDRKTECDSMVTSSVGIFIATSTAYIDLQSFIKKGGTLAEGSALTVYEDGEKHNVYTFVFKPYEFLGNDKESVWYSARLTNDIKNKEAVIASEAGVFSKNLGKKYYEWNFETGTEIDFAPPHVVDVYPSGNGAEPAKRNTIIQITFSEAMDPTAVQGTVKEMTDFTNIMLNTVLNGAANSVEGNWKLVNNYRTVEFVSNLTCGQNSCGKTMYCLPLDCPLDDKNCVKPYSAIIRTADLLPGSQLPFEGIPFSGVMDMSGNALDNGPDKKPDHKADGKPPVANPLLINANENKPDNYWWSFNILNQIDRSAPFVEKVEPNIDGEQVEADAPLRIYFNSRMSFETLHNVSLEEYPEAANGVEPIWFSPFSENKADALGGKVKTVTELKHRVFGPNNTDLYYFPAVPSTATNLAQSCLYPGWGPVEQGAGGISALCQVVYNEEGNVVKTEHCVKVTAEDDKDTGCVQLTDLELQLQPTVSACTSTLSTKEVSPKSEK